MDQSGSQQAEGVTEGMEFGGREVEEGEEEGEGGLELDMCSSQWSLGSGGVVEGTGEGWQGGEGRWRREGGVNCTTIEETLQQEKEQGAVFTVIITASSCPSALLQSPSPLTPSPTPVPPSFPAPSLLHLPTAPSPSLPQVQQLQEQVGQLAESQSLTDDRYTR